MGGGRAAGLRANGQPPGMAGRGIGGGMLCAYITILDITYWTCIYTHLFFYYGTAHADHHAIVLEYASVPPNCRSYLLLKPGTLFVKTVIINKKY